MRGRRPVVWRLWRGRLSGWLRAISDAWQDLFRHEIALVAGESCPRPDRPGRGFQRGHARPIRSQRIEAHGSRSYRIPNFDPTLEKRLKGC